MTINSILPPKSIDVGPLPLSQGDRLLFLSGVLFLARSLAEKMELSASLSKEFVMYAAPLALDLYAFAGESLSSVGSALTGDESFEKVFYELPRLAIAAALTGAKYVLVDKMQDHPLLKPALLVLNAYGTYSVAQRAFVQLNKCVALAKDPNKAKGTYSVIAKNALVHTFNASYSAYRTGSLLLACKSVFFGTTNKEQIDEIIRLSDQYESTMEARILEQQSLRRQKWMPEAADFEIRKALEKADQKELACKIFKSACKLEGNERKEEVEKIYGVLRFKLHPDKNTGNKERADRAFKILGQAKDLLLPKRIKISDIIDSIVSVTPEQGISLCERLDPTIKWDIEKKYNQQKNKLKECEDDCEEIKEDFEKAENAYNLCFKKTLRSFFNPFSFR